VISPDLAVPESPDHRDGLVYVMSADLELAVRVALVTGRPLLLRGAPGSGKSSLAAFLARSWGWRYYEHVVTSRTEARDLLWTFDLVRRLADAQAGRRGEELNDHDYVAPGVLWWALAPASARNRGRAGSRPAAEPFTTLNTRPDLSPAHAVVLIDEIDKAEPDLPNNLLVPLGSTRFVVAETGTEVAREALDGGHLIIVTTNEERELPPAFVRRCVVAWLPHPGEEQLVAIAAQHSRAYRDDESDDDAALIRELAAEVIRTRTAAVAKRQRPPSTAEFLDAVIACRRLGIGVASPEWAQLRELLLLKAEDRTE
jgi:MoxR-like ATPase